MGATTGDRIEIDCWSQDTGRVQKICEMSSKQAFKRNHAERLCDRMQQMDSSTDHVYSWREVT